MTPGPFSLCSCAPTTVLLMLPLVHRTGVRFRHRPHAKTEIPKPTVDETVAHARRDSNKVPNRFEIQRIWSILLFICTVAT